MIKKEIAGIYNVTFNDKKATPVQTQIQTDIELIENAIIESVVIYVKGYHSVRRDRGYGAEHIKLHLEEDFEGYISIEELLNLGRSIREYTTIFKEPFIKNSGRKVYEWENDKGVRFRAIVDKFKGEGLNPPLSPSDDFIITFYSDRNLNERMQFENPEVLKHYQNKQHLENKSKLKKLIKVKPQEKGMTR